MRTTEQADAVTEITSLVRGVMFHSADSAFTIFEAVPTDSSHPARDKFTATGTVGSLKIGEKIILRGNWTDHPKYGLQFQVADFSLPDFRGGGIADFLASGCIKGIGPALAERIIAKFGDKTSEILDTNPRKLLTVNGIGQRKFTEIIASWNENSGKREVLAAFAQFKLGPKTVQKILQRWENPRDALHVLNNTPYLLAWEISGVGFLKADEIARKKGFSLNHPDRVQAAIAYVLDEAAKKEGHCFLPFSLMVERVCELICAERNNQPPSPHELQLIESCLRSLCASEKVVEVAPERIYLAPVYRTESALRENIQTLLDQSSASAAVPAERIDRYEMENKFSLHPQQRQAVLDAHQKNFHIITGGPGTGKTTIIKAILATLSESVEKVSLAAPTGRAAKRMEESTGKPARTIHRLLEFNPGLGGWTFNKKNPLPADLVIIDEASMLDVFLARALTDAIKPGAKLLLIGDIDQLPSVGAGNILNDLLESPLPSRTRLTHIYRQSEDSFISVNARAVITGKPNEMNLSNNTSDFFWMGIEDGYSEASTAADKAELIQSKLIRAVKRLLELKNSPNDIQVLSPTYKGSTGVNALNEILQNICNPNALKKEVGHRLYAVGDRVMQLRNNYDKDVFNGDQGFIAEINEDDGFLTVNFGNQSVKYEFKEADELTLAYAITVHKSQGSEAPIIVLPVAMSHYVMLQRNLLYTAITRAKRMCVLIGEKRALNHAIRNTVSNKRYTALLN